MNASQRAADDLEAVLMALALALVASSDADPHKVAALLSAAAQPGAGLSESSSAMLLRIAQATSSWVHDTCQVTAVPRSLYH